jgi:heat shock protein HslJ
MRILFVYWACLLWASCGNNPQPEKSLPKAIGGQPPKLVDEKADTILAGSWVLEALPQCPTPINTLFPRQRPNLLIQPELKLISGTTGCNRFSASVATTGNQLSISDLTRSTLVCAGDAEPAFLKALEHSVRFSLASATEMKWGTDSVTWMVLRRR